MDRRKLQKEHMLGTGKDMNKNIDLVLPEYSYSLRRDRKVNLAEYNAIGSKGIGELVKGLQDLISRKIVVLCSTPLYSMPHEGLWLLRKEGKSKIWENSGVVWFESKAQESVVLQTALIRRNLSCPIFVLLRIINK